MAQDYVCSKCERKLEWKQGELFSICEYCNLSHQLPDKEYEEAWGKQVGKGTFWIKYGMICGTIIGTLISIAGFLGIFVPALLMPMIFAGQYLILGMMVVIVGITVSALSLKYGGRDYLQRVQQNRQKIIRKSEEQFGVEFENESKGSNFCESCGNPLKPTAKFCGGCGTQRS